ncbi:hypothetical protein SEA_MACGULLY_86 [Rhodococcus phage MacGully]|nr:hypothetical protein SEA_MACGULLY_86 [Rhodococcus phage MacGully]
MNARGKVRIELNEYPDEFLKCRTMGHAWTEDTVEARNRWWFREWMRCRDCPCKRYRDIHRVTGFITKSHTQYPDSRYLVSGGRLTAAENGALRLRRITNAK